MPIVSPEPSQSSVPWGVALAATSILLIGGGAVVWAHREPPAPDVAGPGTPPTMIRHLPLALSHEIPMETARATADVDPQPLSRVSPGLHSVELAVENGTRVVRIRVAPAGDELVVDAATGRLLEARPSRPSAATPTGRFAAPAVPAT